MNNAKTRQAILTCFTNASCNVLASNLNSIIHNGKIMLCIQVVLERFENGLIECWENLGGYSVGGHDFKYCCCCCRVMTIAREEMKQFFCCGLKVSDG